MSNATQTEEKVAQSNWGVMYRENIADLVNKRSQNESEVLSEVYALGYTRLLDIRKSSVKDYPNPTLYFKAGEAQKAVYDR